MKIKRYNPFLDLEKDEPINEEVGLRNLKKIAKSLDGDLQSAIKAQQTQPTQSVDMSQLDSIVKENKNCK